MIWVCKDSSPRSFPVWIRGTDKRLNVNPWKFVWGNYVTLWQCHHQLPHMHFTQRDAAMYVAKHHRFNGRLSECHYFILITVIWSILCAKFIYFLFPLQISYAFTVFCPVEPLITEHVIRIAAIWNTDMQYKLLSVEESCILLIWQMLLKIFLSRKWCKSFAFM